MVARMDQNHIPNNKPPILESDYGNAFVMRIRPSSDHRAGYNKQNNQNTGDNMNEQNSMLNDLKKLFRYNDSNDANSLTTEQQINMLKQNHALLREKMDAECEYYGYRKRQMIESCKLFCEIDTKKQKFIDDMIAIEQTIKLLGGKMDAPDAKKSDDDGDDDGDDE